MISFMIYVAWFLDFLSMAIMLIFLLCLCIYANFDFRFIKLDII